MERINNKDIDITYHRVDGFLCRTYPITTNILHAAILAMEFGKLKNFSKYLLKRRKKKMYGPNLSELAAVAIRRLAWAMETNMGKAIDALVICLQQSISAEKVCAACKDTTKCTACAFKITVTTPQKLSPLLKQNNPACAGEINLYKGVKK